MFTALNDADTKSITVVPSSAASHQFATGIGSGGTIAYAQLGLGDLSGSATIGQLPAAAASDVIAGTSSSKVVTPSALSGSSAILTLTDGATISWDMSQGYNAVVTIAGNRTMAAPTNFQVGEAYTLQVVQDATGSRTMSWNAAFDWDTTGAPALSTSANAIDLVTLLCVSSAPKFIAIFAKGF